MNVFKSRLILEKRINTHRVSKVKTKGLKLHEVSKCTKDDLYRNEKREKQLELIYFR